MPKGRKSWRRRALLQIARLGLTRNSGSLAIFAAIRRAFIARELCAALSGGALRAHGAIGWEQFAAVGLTRIEADTVSSWDYNCRKSRLERLRSLRLQC